MLRDLVACSVFIMPRLGQYLRANAKFTPVRSPLVRIDPFEDSLNVTPSQRLLLKPSIVVHGAQASSVLFLHLRAGSAEAVG